MSSAAFVARLRTHGAPIDLVPPGDGAARWSLRVQLLDGWDAVRVETAPSVRVATVVEAALRALAGADARIDRYDVKLRGVRVLPLTQSLADAGVLDGATLLLVHAARQPVR